MPKRIEPIHRRNGKVIVVRGEVSKAKSRVELAKYRSCTEENWTNETPPQESLLSLISPRPSLIYHHIWEFYRYQIQIN